MSDYHKIQEYDIHGWVLDAKSAIGRAIQAGEAGRALTLLDLVRRLEREIIDHPKPKTPQPVAEEKEEPVPF